MPFDRPTLTTLIDRAVSDIQTQISGATTLLRRSVLKVLAKVQAGANHLLYGYLDYQSKQLFATTADQIGLISHGQEWGMDRDDAVAATGSAVVTGTTGLTVPADTELQSADGQIYTVDEDVVIAGGTGTIDLTAQEAGADGNQDASTTLIFVSPISGINSSATVDSDGLNNGEDIEDVEDWRARILSRKRNPPHGGAEHDYITWMLEVDGVTRAWCIPLYNGVGTVGCAFVRDEESPIIPSASELDTVESYIISHTDEATGKTVGIPVTAEPGLFMVTLAELDVDMTISIYPNTVAVQNAIDSAIEDALYDHGGPGETVYLSQLQKAIASTAVEWFRIDSPVVDSVATQTQVHVVGTITYQDYT